MNKNEAIQEVREELIMVESRVFDQVIYLQQGTCQTILNEISEGQDIPTKLLAVEVNEIINNLKKVEDLRKTLSILESIE
jgi:DNA repair exonuclease SbcCD ATPase subunit